MIPTDRQAAALAFYGPLAASPDAARRVGWDASAAHALRLAAIADSALAYGPTSVLDAGCGEGALLPALRGAGFVGAYRGEDVLAHMIDHAQTVHADTHATFVVADAFARAADAPKADAVLCSGALNTVVVADHDAEVGLALEALWARAGSVLAIDLAVADRHAAGVGIARADLARAWSAARKLAPVVVVREDVIPGEALLVLARSRAPAYARWQPDGLLRAQLLLAAGEPDAALAAVQDDVRPAATLIRGRGSIARGALLDAERALRLAAACDEPAVADAARLELAPLAWRRGDKARAESVLRALVDSTHVGDDARAHLAMLLSARDAQSEALGIAAGIVDPWIRREIEARLGGAPMAKSERSS